MKSELFKWFLIWLSAMIVGIGLFWAFGPTAKKIDLQEINYKTTESSVLYFKNMRAYFYEKEEEERSGYHIYRINSREESGRSKLHFMIVQNWRMNEAYIILESDLVDLEKMKMQLRLDSTVSILEGLDAESNYSFAAKLFEALEEEKSISLILEEEDIPLNLSEQKSIKKSLKDYFKLVGKLR